MKLLRVAVVIALAGLGPVGCAVGGPDRASDIQNLHGISDDISAVTMTDSHSRYAHDPNASTTLPNNYQTHDQP
jgi:hypothetical protein